LGGRDSLDTWGLCTFHHLELRAQELRRLDADRVKGLLRAVGVEEDFVISGGISKNVGVVRRVEQKLATTSHICFEPQVVGTLGAALFARDFLGGKA
jgi:hypothetical protein